MSRKGKERFFLPSDIGYFCCRSADEPYMSGKAWIDLVGECLADERSKGSWEAFFRIDTVSASMEITFVANVAFFLRGFSKADSPIEASIPAIGGGDKEGSPPLAFSLAPTVEELEVGWASLDDCRGFFKIGGGNGVRVEFTEDFRDAFGLLLKPVPVERLSGWALEVDGATRRLDGTRGMDCGI